LVLTSQGEKEKKRGGRGEGGRVPSSQVKKNRAKERLKPACSNSKKGGRGGGGTTPNVIEKRGNGKKGKEKKKKVGCSLPCLTKGEGGGKNKKNNNLH